MDALLLQANTSSVLSSYKGIAVDSCCNSKSSLLIRKNIPFSLPNVISVFFEEIKHSLLRISKDPLGTMVLQTLLIYCHSFCSVLANQTAGATPLKNICNITVDILTGRIQELSCHTYGSGVVQVLLLACDERHRKSMGDELIAGCDFFVLLGMLFVCIFRFDSVINEPSGSKTIQHLFKCVSGSHKKSLINAFLEKHDILNFVYNKNFWGFLSTFLQV
jgi:hypothetical protein